jgi:phosphohistidine phosphatase SixA
MLIHRHSSAGEKLESPSLDQSRSLDRIGQSDAQALPEALAEFHLARIVSSPHRRCVDTVAPLAAARGLEIERRDELAPDAVYLETRALLEELPNETIVCTHREVIQRLFDGKIACEKGGTWVVERRGSRLFPVEYLPPATTKQGGRRVAELVPAP